MAIQSAEEFEITLFGTWPRPARARLIAARDAAIRAEAVERAVVILRKHQFFNVAELLAVESRTPEETVDAAIAAAKAAALGGDNGTT